MLLILGQRKVNVEVLSLAPGGLPDTWNLRYHP